MATLQVGPTRTLTTAALAAAVAGDGDRIEIDAGLYVNDIATWKAAHLTIVGVGGIPHFASPGQGNDFTWRLLGANPTLEDLEFSGMSGNGGSAAALKLSASGLTALRRLFIHENDNGVLGDNNLVAADILLEDCRLTRNGDGSGSDHNIYIGYNTDSLTMRRCLSTRARGGHLVKSRAKATSLLACQLIDLPTMDPQAGGASFEANFPDGGIVLIQDCLLEKGPNAENFAMVRYGETPIGPFGPDASPAYARNEFHSVRTTYVNDAGWHESSLFLDLKYARIPTISESVDDVFRGGGIIAAGPLTRTVSGPRIALTIGAFA